jgi:lipoprotein signal peptidase
MSHVFIGASVLALLFVLWLFAGSGRRQWMLHTALALILAGAFGNLYDRWHCQATIVTFRGQGGGESYEEVLEVVGDPDADPLLLRPWGTDEPGVPTPRDRILSVEHLGVVRDFIRFEPKIAGRPIWPWVFNIADVALTGGVAILLVQFWFEQRRTTPVPDATPGETA